MYDIYLKQCYGIPSGRPLELFLDIGVRGQQCDERVWCYEKYKKETSNNENKEWCCSSLSSSILFFFLVC